MTMNLAEQQNHALSYHPLTPGRGDIHEKLREAAKAYAEVVRECCNISSRESSLAFTAIQESLMWANAAVAIYDPNLE